MPRDIDQLVATLRIAHPGITAERRRETDPDTDDEGVWSINHPDAFMEVRVATPTGDVPFTVESDVSPPTPVKTVDAAVKMVRARLGLTVIA